MPKQKDEPSLVIFLCLSIAWVIKAIMEALMTLVVVILMINLYVAYVKYLVAATTATTDTVATVSLEPNSSIYEQVNSTHFSVY